MKLTTNTLREKCSNTEIFLVRIFLYSVRSDSVKAKAFFFNINQCRTLNYMKIALNFSNINQCRTLKQKNALIVLAIFATHLFFNIPNFRTIFFNLIDL